MLYLDYAKKMDNGYIMNFFADKEEDILTVSDGKSFVTNNGTNYGVPLESSTIVITMPDKTKKTYVLDKEGEWKELGDVVFAEKQNLAGYQNTKEYLYREFFRVLLTEFKNEIESSSFNIYNPIPEEIYNTILTQDDMLPYAAVKDGNYYTIRFVPEEGVGGEKWGKPLSLSSGYHEYRREPLDVNKKYLLNLYPTTGLNKSMFEADVNFYQWICKVMASKENDYAVMVDDNCTLTYDELVHSNWDENTPGAPEIFLGFWRFAPEDTIGISGDMLEGAYTTKECEYFLFECTELD